MSAQILLTEDDLIFRKSIATKLSKYGIVHEASNVIESRNILATHDIDAAFIDLNLSSETECDGLEILDFCKPKNILSIVLTGHDTKDIIKKAYENGCDHYYTKRDFKDNLDQYVGGILKNLKSDSLQKFFTTKFITSNEDLKTSIKYIESMPLSSDHKILITGPTGVGKSKLAKLIHEMHNPGTPFVNLNLSELPENLIESELFGHVKGAFTGANSDKQGILSRANSGTLFLDEIGTIPIHIQKKLLKVIEEKTFRKVGSTKDERSDFSLITATCDDLQRLIEEEKFRLDFYFRIKGFELKIPGLIERKKDVIEQIDFFISKSPKKIAFNGEAENALLNYPWPGNTRELMNLITELTALPKGYITCDDLPDRICKNQCQPIHEPSEGFLTNAMVHMMKNDGLPSLIKEVERKALELSLEETNGRINEACRVLKISKSLLYRIQKEGENVQ